jgi:hypothetical protein
MNDEVNNPSHYNQNGIEVIDVIETYTPDSPHLANVLKYVCRHSYKGNPLKDLRKAAWYLDRAIILIEDAEEEECLPVDEWRTKSSGYSPREVEVFFQGYDCRKQEEAEERGLTRDEVAEQFEASTTASTATKSRATAPTATRRLVPPSRTSPGVGSMQACSSASPSASTTYGNGKGDEDR